MSLALTDDLSLGWLNFLKIDKGLSANTLLAYQSDARLFLEFLSKRGEPLDSVTHKVITDFLFEQKSLGKSPATLVRYIETIRQLYKYLIGEGKMSKDPTLALFLPKRPERLPK